MMASPGNRNNAAYKACRDVGRLVAMGLLDKKEVKAKEDRLLKIATRNKSVDAVGSKEALNRIRKRIHDGYESTLAGEGPPDPLGSEEESMTFWASRDSYMGCFMRSVEYANPMAALLSELTVLASHLDHRVVLVPQDPKIKDGLTYIPAPISLFAAIVGDPGDGKSTIISKAEEWGKSLPELASPPRRPEQGKRGVLVDIEDKLPDYARDEAAAPIPNTSAVRTGPGIAQYFCGTVTRGSGKKADPYIKKILKVRWRALVSYDESADLFSRLGEDHNLGQALRSGFFSAPINPATARDDGTFSIEGGSYSISMLAAVLPKNMKEVLDWEDNGMFQRLVIMPVDNHPPDMTLLEPYESLAARQPLPEWVPVGKPKKKKAKVFFDKAIYKDLKDMRTWAKTGNDNDYSERDIERWLSLTADYRKASLKQHVSVKLLRLAALLALYDGVEMVDGKVTIPWGYYEDAHVVLQHSAAAVRHYRRSAILKRKNQERTEAERELRVERHKARQRNSSDSSLTDAERIILYAVEKLEQSGGEILWVKLNDEKPRKYGFSSKEFKAILLKSGRFEIVGRPAIVTMKEEV